MSGNAIPLGDYAPMIDEQLVESYGPLCACNGIRHPGNTWCIEIARRAADLRAMRGARFEITRMGIAALCLEDVE